MKVRVLAGLFLSACSLIQSAGSFAADSNPPAAPRDPQLAALFDGYVKEQMPGLPYEVLAGAKKEGAVAFYHVRIPATTDALVKEFKKQFPFMSVEEYDNSGPGLHERFMTEQRAKSGHADVIQFANPTLAAQAISEGYLATYTPTSAGKFDKGFVRDGLWYPSGLSTRIVYMYNKNIVSDAQAQKLKSYDAMWKETFSNRGVAVLDGVSSSNGQLYYYFLEKQYGPESWATLAAKKPFVGSSTPAADAVTRGEVGVGLASESIAQEAYASGAPVRWVVPQPSLVEAWPLAVPQSAPHPNAARLLYEFLLSKPGQTIFGENGLVSTRSDVVGEPKVASEPWFTKYKDRKNYQIDLPDYEKALTTMADRFKKAFAK